jgi:hypothetical protein
MIALLPSETVDLTDVMAGGGGGAFRRRASHKTLIVG